MYFFYATFAYGPAFSKQLFRDFSRERNEFVWLR